jgi:hypothetical protein
MHPYGPHGLCGSRYITIICAGAIKLQYDGVTKDNLIIRSIKAAATFKCPNVLIITRWWIFLEVFKMERCAQISN